MDNTSKPTNPKDMLGSTKLPLHLFPTSAIALGCLSFLNGALKYGRANFRKVGVRTSIYVDAALRHINAYMEGEECDPEDGVDNLGAALACIAIIIDARAAGKLNDDRNLEGGYRANIDKLTKEVERIQKMHAHRDVPKHYTIADNTNNAERVSADKTPVAISGNGGLTTNCYRCGHHYLTAESMHFCLASASWQGAQGTTSRYPFGPKAPNGTGL